MVVIEAKCSNDHCCIWQSQSCQGTLPWRDMLCAAAALFTRSNPAQVFTFFKNNGLPYISLRTYHYLPHPWCELCLDQWTAVPFNFQVKHTDVGCDARCDTPGHCVKYSTYPTVELDNNKALTIELVQVHSVVTIWSMSQAPINTVTLPFHVKRSFKITLFKVNGTCHETTVRIKIASVRSASTEHKSLCQADKDAKKSPYQHRLCYSIPEQHSNWPAFLICPNSPPIFDRKQGK